MTVMVTGASGVIGRAAVAALLKRNPEVRVAVRRDEDAERLRALGAKVTLDRLDDAPALAEVLWSVHTLVHLVGGVNQVNDGEVFGANHRSTLVALGAARSAGVHRFVFVSYPGASVDATHAFLRAKGVAEEAVVHSGLEHAVLRCTHVFGEGGLWFTSFVEGARDGFLVGEGLQSLAPVYAEDVARVIAAIDDRTEPVHGVWGLEGPQAWTADELAGTFRGDDAIEHLASAEAAPRLSRVLGIPVSEATCEVFASDSRADAPDAAAAFGVERTPFPDALARVVAALGLEG